MYEYKKEIEAKKKLDLIIPFLIKNKNLVFAAVTKLENGNYTIKRGLRSKENFDDEFGFNEELHFLKNDLYRDFKEGKLSKIKKKEFNKMVAFVESERSNSISFEKTEKIILDKDNSDTLTQYKPPNNVFRGGQSIGTSETLGGTLGGVFKLADFPNEYFAIGNWHYLAFNNQLGRDIFSPEITTWNTSRHQEQQYKCGNTSWANLDPEMECAFVHLNKEAISIDKKNSCGYTLSGNISKPKIGDLVKKCGNQSGCNDDNIGVCKNSHIYSSYATIKVTDTVYGTNEPYVFKNQVMVKDIHDKGDSGSLLVNSKNDVVAILFAQTQDRVFSIANNINTIFNRTFNISQPFLLNNKLYYVNKFELEKIY